MPTRHRIPPQQVPITRDELRRLVGGGGAVGTTGVASFNSRTGEITLLGSDVTTALSFTPVTNARAINTTAPLTGGGNLGADLTLGISAATTAAAGSMSAADKTKLDGISGTNTGDQFTNIASSSFIGRVTAGFGPAERLSVTDAQTLLGISGTNTGDETKATIDTKIGVGTNNETFYRKDGSWQGVYSSESTLGANSTAVAPTQSAVRTFVQSATWNGLVNPSFEAGVYGWALPAGTVTSESTGGFSNRHLKLTGLTSATAVLTNNNARLPVKAGDIVRARGWFKIAAATTGTAQIEIRFLNAAFGDLGAVGLGNAAVKDGTWQLSEVKVAAPANAVFAYVRYRFNNPATADVYEVDATSYDNFGQPTIADVTGLQAALDTKAGTATATTSAAGLMSAADKTKLDSVPATIRETFINVLSNGLANDNSTDNRTPLQTLVNNVSAAGGGTLYAPEGIYLFGDGGTSTSIDMANNVGFVGDGHSTIFKQLSGLDANLFTLSDHTGCFFRNLCLDGNRAGNAAGSLIHLVGATNLTIDSVLLRQAAAYGIGMQGGIMKTVKILNTVIEDTGADGIDIKNKLNGNEDVQLDNVSVRRWGLNDAKPTQAAIDLRGIGVMCNNIFVAEPGQADSVGFRFREGSTTDVHGEGAQESMLSNFDIRMGNGSNQIGVYVAAADAMLANGRITGGLLSVRILERSCHANQVVAKSASGDGWQIISSSPYIGHSAILMGCSARNCGGDGFDIAANDVRLIAPTAVGNTGAGWRTASGVTGTKVRDALLASNTGGNYTDAGTGTSIT